VNCSDFQDKADALLDGEFLPIEEREDLEAHLMLCAGCRLEYQLDSAVREIYRNRYHYNEVPSQSYERVKRIVDREYSTLLHGSQPTTVTQPRHTLHLSTGSRSSTTSANHSRAGRDHYRREALGSRPKRDTDSSSHSLDVEY
jgi:hypothetical protein